MLSRILSAVAGVALAGLMTAPAYAGHNRPKVDVAVADCAVTFTLTANDGGQHAGGVEWLQYRLNGGDIVNVPIDGSVPNAQVDDYRGGDTVKWRVWGGPERDYDNPAVTAAVDDAFIGTLDDQGRPTDATDWGWNTADAAGAACPEPTQEPTNEPTHEPTDGPSETPSTQPTPSHTNGGGGGSLPVTGTPVAAMVGVGVLLVGAGGGLMLLRRRRERFEA